ncbi:MAG: hypothetical protein UY42_C0002G0048, partial [Parcubacteria group bacterium GW2011_GWA2_49_16]
RNVTFVTISLKTFILVFIVKGTYGALYYCSMKMGKKGVS